MLGRLTKRSKVHCLLTKMCAQIVRRQSRDRLAGLSGLSNMHFHWYDHRMFPGIPVSIREEIIPSINFWLSCSSKNTGKKIIERLSVTSKRWIVSETLLNLPRYLTSPRFRNFSAESNRYTSTSSSNVPWKSFTRKMTSFPSQLSIHPASPAGTAVIIIQNEPERSENTSWKPLLSSISINRSSPDSRSRKAGSMIQNMHSLSWKNATNATNLNVISWTRDTTPRKCTGLSANPWTLTLSFQHDLINTPKLSGVNIERKWRIISTSSDTENGSWWKLNSLSLKEGSGLTWNPGYSKSRKRKSHARLSSPTLTDS